jgi:hypothetical protein
MSVVNFNAFYRCTTKDLKSVLKNHDDAQSTQENLTTAQDFDHALRTISTSKFIRLTAV